MMNRKYVLFLACCAASCLAACNESAHMEYPCEEGVRSCKFDKIVVCKDGKEVVETQCQDGLLCDPSLLECGEVFQLQCSDEDARKCLHNYLLVCRDGEWKLLESCSEAQTCNAVTSTCDGGDEPEACSPDGARKCEDNRVMVCDGAWSVEKTCKDDELCNEETFECDPKTEPQPCDEEGARKCDDNRVMICEDGTWSVEKPCLETEVCNEGTFECDPSVSKDCDEEGATRCSADASQLEICTDGVWAGEDCRDQLCVDTDEGARCVECQIDDTRCVVEDGVSLLSKCVNYQWNEPEACLETDAEKLVCDANPGKSCVNVLELLQCPEEGNVACQDVYGQEYAVICEDGVVTEASGVCEDGLVCDVPEGGCTTPDVCGNEIVGAGEDCEEGMLGESSCASVTGDVNASGELACLECKYDVTNCLYCGDGVVNNSEVCDGSVPEGATCTSVIDDGKIYTGTLSCKDDCTFDLTNCTEEIVEDCTPENCTTADPNATAACVENVCKVTCNEGFMDVGGVCTSTACTAEDTKCSEGIFYLCGSNDTLEAIPMPEDGKHYICDAATSTGWVEVECLEASHCSTTDVNAMVDCVANACVVTCKDTFTDVDGVCTAVVCEPGGNTCDGINLMVCNAKGTGYELVEACTTSDPNATATCEGNACKVACNIDFVDVDGVCTALQCEPGAKACNGTDLMVCNEKGTDYDLGETCSSAPENGTALCDDTKGACTFECNTGYELNSEETGCDREILACNFQWISADAGAFGNVALNGKTKEDYEGRLVCIDQTDSTKIVTLDAVYNMDRDANVEFGVLDLSGINAGTYNCTFEFKLASSASWYACQGVEYEGTWAAPILINGDDYSAIPASEWYREYTVQLCTPEERVCEGEASYKVCASDGLSYGEVTPCEKPDHAETMACNVDKCEVATCEGNWSVKSDKSGCECTGDYVLNGDECVAKCTDADIKCEGDNYYKCEETGLLSTTAKPTDGKNYICKEESGWVEVACTEASHCTTIPEHATMACNAENTCEVASCDGNWSVKSDKSACECTGEYVLDGTECIAKCTDADNKCEGDNYYQCESTGLVSTTPKPTDGNHYICKDASGWEAVACTEASHCTAVDHATMACNAENTCEVASCEGNWSVKSDKSACECTGEYVIFNGDCVALSSVTCTLDGVNYAVDSYACSTDGTTQLHCESNGEFAEIQSCEFGCSSGSCDDPNNCTDFDGNDVEHGESACSTEVNSAICDDGSWKNETPCITTVLNASPVCEDEGVCGFVCNDGFVKNAAGTACERSIEACNFEWIGYAPEASADQAVGHVTQSGWSDDDYDAQLVCINKTNPEDKFIQAADYEEPVDSNYRFRVAAISGVDPGKYDCTFEFKLASQDTWYSCKGISYTGGDWGTPILLSGDDYSVIPESGWYREYIVQLCTPGAQICEGAAQYKVCDSEGLSYGAAQDCPTDAHGTASCSGEGACSIACDDGYELVGGVCSPKSCIDYAGKTIADGGDGCETNNRWNTCHLGTWSTDSSEYVDCDWGCDSTTDACKVPVGCTDYNNTELAHGELGCKTATQVAECENGSMIDEMLCTVGNATGVKCVGKGDCEATACQDGYHVKDGACEANVCTPNELLECSGSYYTRCSADGSEEEMHECEAKSNATATAVCNADGSVTCNYACTSGYQWNSDMTECVEIHCTDAVSGNTLDYGDLGCASSNAYGLCGDGGIFDSETIEYCDVIAHGTNLCQAGECAVTCDANHEYNTTTEKCEPTISICEPDQWECTGDTCQLCNDDGTEYINTYTCTAMENATATASWNSVSEQINCSYQCNEGFNPNTAMNACLPVICTANSVTCSEGVQTICNAYGTETTTNNCSAPANATASCNGNECDFVCDYGYEKDSTGEACQVVNCTPGEQKCDGTDVLTCNTEGNAYDRSPCPSVDHATTTCSGAGVCDFTCDGGFTKGTNTCDREVLACNFQAYDSNSMYAYGRLNTNGRPVSDYEGRLVCMKQSGTTTYYYTINAYQNTGANVSPNVEFMTTTNQFPEGNYQCSFEFKLNTSETWFTCQGVEEGWGTPIPIYGTDYSAVPETGWFRNVNISYENKKTGDTLVFGTYNGSPIEWYILQKNTANRYFKLISVNVLTNRPFSDNESCTWTSSTLRSWLNGTGSYQSDNFISSAFTSEEQAKLRSSSGDKVSLLSKNDAETLWGTGQYACQNYCSMSNCNGGEGSGGWWTNTVENSGSGYYSKIGYVVMGGIEGNDSYNSTYCGRAWSNRLLNNWGVRPVILLNY